MSMELELIQTTKTVLVDERVLDNVMHVSCSYTKWGICRDRPLQAFEQMSALGALTY